MIIDEVNTEITTEAEVTNCFNIISLEKGEIIENQ
jgi:hypothetical protein